MKYRIFKLKSIGDDPNIVSALLTFSQPLGQMPTLSSYLNCIMEEKKLTAPDVYHRAELDRQTFNKVVQFTNPKRASKRTLLQICIGIHASEREATDLLATCGYTFELSAVEDQSFMFCIRNGFYDMYNVYEAMEILEKSPSNA